MCKNESNKKQQKSIFEAKTNKIKKQNKMLFSKKCFFLGRMTESVMMLGV